MKQTSVIAALSCAVLLAGCAATGGDTSSTESKPAVSTASAPAGKSSSSAGKAAAVTSSSSSSAASSAKGGIPPGMNARGEVVDSSKVEGGNGTKVKVGEWEGEITGKPAPKGKFGKLKIGMTMKQVMDLIGQPSDQGAYITGKAWIPFYFGSDRHRYEFVYKGSGRLIFAGGGFGDWSSGHLIWIIHNANEPATR